jgi:two-component system sensor histidine kinase DegS
MRSQLERLQSDNNRLKRYSGVLERALRALESSQPGDSQRDGVQVETVQMIIQAQEMERQRLSRQMHDGPAQALSNFILQTDIALRLFDLDQAKAKEELGSLKLTATNTFQKVRDFIFELRPMMLDDLGLVPTLKKYIEVFNNQPGLDVALTTTGEELQLDSHLDVMLFRAIQDLLSNAIQVGQASQVKVQMDFSEPSVKVSVEDNGKSFDLQSEDELRNKSVNVIHDRVEMLGGTLHVESVTGQGSHINFQLPTGNL